MGKKRSDSEKLETLGNEIAEIQDAFNNKLNELGEEAIDFKAFDAKTKIENAVKNNKMALSSLALDLKKKTKAYTELSDKIETAQAKAGSDQARALRIEQLSNNPRELINAIDTAVKRWNTLSKEWPIIEEAMNNVRDHEAINQILNALAKLNEDNNMALYFLEDSPGSETEKNIRTELATNISTLQSTLTNRLAKQEQTESASVSYAASAAPVESENTPETLQRKSTVESPSRTSTHTPVGIINALRNDSDMGKLMGKLSSINIRSEYNRLQHQDKSPIKRMKIFRNKERNNQIKDLQNTINALSRSWNEYLKNPTNEENHNKCIAAYDKLLADINELSPKLQDDSTLKKLAGMLLNDLQISSVETKMDQARRMSTSHQDTASDLRPVAITHLSNTQSRRSKVVSTPPPGIELQPRLSQQPDILQAIQKVDTIIQQHKSKIGGLNELENDFNEFKRGNIDPGEFSRKLDQHVIKINEAINESISHKPGKNKNLVGILQQAQSALGALKGRVDYHPTSRTRLR